MVLRLVFNSTIKSLVNRQNMICTLLLAFFWCLQRSSGIRSRGVPSGLNDVIYRQAFITEVIFRWMLMSVSYYTASEFFLYFGCAYDDRGDDRDDGSEFV